MFEKRIMLAPNRLRIDPSDGTPAVEYRIADGRVESRPVELAPESTAAPWLPLSPEQLTAHVLADTVVAHWLSRRLGIGPLIRACSQHSSATHDGVQQEPRFAREVVVAEFSPLMRNERDQERI